MRNQDTEAFNSQFPANAVSDDLLELARAFVAEVLIKETFYQKLEMECAVDLILLAGSAVRGASDAISDVDIFLVTDKRSQRRLGLVPVRHYEFRSVRFEVSMFASEKVFRDAANKANFEWWMGSRIIRCGNRALRGAFEEAASFSREDLLDRLWTNYVIYMINTSKLEQCRLRNDPISSYACYHESVQGLVHTLLAKEGRFSHNKWYGENLRAVSGEKYQFVLGLYEAKGSEIFERNVEIGKCFVAMLHDAGFPESEIADFEHCNLHRILFQLT
jgi:predicted nucleotidyltransferase